MIKVVYFASIREQLERDQEQLELAPGSSVATLLTLLRSRGAPWDQALGGTALLVAVNQEMTNLARVLSPGDEVAFFPPVTGG